MKKELKTFEKTRQAKENKAGCFTHEIGRNMYLAKRLQLSSLPNIPEKRRVHFYLGRNLK